MKRGDVVMDYGTGSGVLGLLALKLGAAKVVAIDIDEDTLQAAKNNFEINDELNNVDIAHTSEVWVGNDRFPKCDFTVANILPGALTRLVVPLWDLTKPGGSLCLSGMRPKDLSSVRSAFLPFVDVNSEMTEILNHEQFGDWIRWTVRTKQLTQEERKSALNSMTEQAME